MTTMAKKPPFYAPPSPSDRVTKEPLGCVHQRPDPKLPRQAALVYQLGYAHVVQVEKSTGEPDQPISRLAKARGTVRLLAKLTFVEAFRLAQGLAMAGWVVETFSVDFAHTDILTANWSRKYEDNPFYLQFERRILSPNGVNAETKEERLARYQRHVSSRKE